ncbi:MAG: hypothetical protein ACRCZI_05535, partial [Cetobacterium sp.]
MSNQENKKAARGRGRGHGRKSKATGARATTKPNAKTGANKTLGGHVFDYGTKNAADQMATTWENIILLAGSTLGEDICNELRNEKPAYIPKPVIPEHAAEAHDTEIHRRNAQKERLIAAKKTALTAIQSTISKTNLDETQELATLSVQEAELENEIEQLRYEIDNPPAVELRGAEKAEYDGEWKTYNLRQSKLVAHRGQIHSTMIGQCTQLLKDKLKQDADYSHVMDSCDPLKLRKLIEKIILSQSDDQYPYATLFEQDKILVGFHQGELTNAQFYEKFNTRVDVAKAVGVTRIHKGAIEHTAKEIYKKDVDDLTNKELEDVEEKAEERYYAYIMLQNSSAEHGKLKAGLVGDYAKGQDHFPKNRQAVLHLLDKHSKNARPRQTPSEGHTFVQKSTRDPKKGNPKSVSFDPSEWAEKTCFVCGEKGHPSYIHKKDETETKNPKAEKKPKKASKKDDASQSSKKSRSSTRSTGSSSASRTSALHKTFTTLARELTTLAKGKDNSDITDSEEESATTHFTWLDVVPAVEKTFTTSDASQCTGVDMRNVILLDNQSTI